MCDIDRDMAWSVRYELLFWTRGMKTTLCWLWGLKSCWWKVIWKFVFETRFGDLFWKRGLKMCCGKKFRKVFCKWNESWRYTLSVSFDVLSGCQVSKLSWFLWQRVLSISHEFLSECQLSKLCWFVLISLISLKWHIGYDDWISFWMSGIKACFDFFDNAYWVWGFNLFLTVRQACWGFFISVINFRTCLNSCFQIEQTL